MSRPGSPSGKAERPAAQPSEFRFRIGFACSFQPRENVMQWLRIPNKVYNKRTFCEMVMNPLSPERRAAEDELKNLEKSGSSRSPAHETSASAIWRGSRDFSSGEKERRRALLECVCNPEDTVHSRYWRSWTMDAGSRPDWYRVKFARSPEYSTDSAEWTTDLMKHWRPTIDRFLLFFTPADQHFEAIVGVQLPGQESQRLAVLKNLYKMEIKFHEALRDLLGVSTATRWRDLEGQGASRAPVDEGDAVHESYNEARGSGDFGAMFRAMDAAKDRPALERARGPPLFRISQDGWLEFINKTKPGLIPYPFPVVARFLAFYIGLMKTASGPVSFPDGTKSAIPIVQGSQLLYKAEVGAHAVPCRARAFARDGTLSAVAMRTFVEPLDWRSFVLLFGLNKFPPSFWTKVRARYSENDRFLDEDESSGAESSEPWNSDFGQESDAGSGAE